MGAADVSTLSVFGQELTFDDFAIASFGWFEGMGLPSSIDTDIEDRTASLLIEQFKTKPRINELVRIFARQVQELEYVLADMLRIKDVNTATGDQLDMLGEYVGESRDGRNDDDYRQAIILRSFINKSNGEPETLIAYTKFLINSDQIEYLPLFPGKCLIQTSGGLLLTSEDVARIQKIAPAGVKVTASYSPGKAFGFDDINGFVDVNATAPDEINVGNPDAAGLKEGII